MKLLGALLLFAASSLATPLHSQNAKITEALTYFPISSQPDWKIFVVPADQWREGLSAKNAQTSIGTCYTQLPFKFTYCRAEWVKGASVRQISHSLAHELGHIICNCDDERTAEAFANRYSH